jgi:hypothetical protein
MWYLLHACYMRHPNRNACYHNSNVSEE